MMNIMKNQKKERNLLYLLTGETVKPSTLLALPPIPPVLVPVEASASRVKKLEGLDPLNFWNSLDSWRVRFPHTPSFRPPLGGFTDSPTYHVGLDLDLFWCYGKYLPWDSVISNLSNRKKSTNPKPPSSNHQLWIIISMIYETKRNHPFWLKSCSNIQEIKCCSF